MKAQQESRQRLVRARQEAMRTARQSIRDGGVPQYQATAVRRNRSRDALRLRHSIAWAYALDIPAHSASRVGPRGSSPGLVSTAPAAACCAGGYLPLTAAPPPPQPATRLRPDGEGPARFTPEHKAQMQVPRRGCAACGDTGTSC